MGAKQSVPKVTAQDRAILEYVRIALSCSVLIHVSSLKLQRDKLKQYQKKVRSPVVTAVDSF